MVASGWWSREPPPAAQSPGFEPVRGSTDSSMKGSVGETGGLASGLPIRRSEAAAIRKLLNSVMSSEARPESRGSPGVARSCQGTPTIPTRVTARIATTATVVLHGLPATAHDGGAGKTLDIALDREQHLQPKRRLHLPAAEVRGIFVGGEGAGSVPSPCPSGTLDPRQGQDTRGEP